MDKNAASIPPNPTTDATARFGNMSDTTVYIVADQPWCAAPARPKQAAASHGLLTYGVAITGNVQHAQTNEAVFRARFTDQPRFKKASASHIPRHCELMESAIPATMHPAY